MRGGRRQQRRRQARKILSVLACPDEGQRLCGEEGANKVAGRSRKPGACWRALTKEKGFAGRKAPTKSPAGQENPERVGVPRRRRKALRGGRRQQSRRLRRIWRWQSLLSHPLFWKPNIRWRRRGPLRKH